MDSLPQLSAYLDSLPAGLASYPHCQTKASLVLSALRGLEQEELLASGLPAELETFIREPPPLGLWVPAVLSDAMFHACCDVFYPTESAMLKWTYERTIDLAKNPLYRGLLKAVGPRRWFRMGPKINRLFQRGTTLVNEVGERQCISEMTFPPRLHDHTNLMSNVPVIRATATLSGAKGVRAKLVEHSDTHARYECTWL